MFVNQFNRSKIAVVVLGKTIFVSEDWWIAKVLYEDHLSEHLPCTFFLCSGLLFCLSGGSVPLVE